MQTSIESLDGLKRKLTITLPADQVSEIYSKHLQKIAKTAKVDGFRPGKVPPDVIEKKFGSGVQQEVVSELVQNSFAKALEEHDLKIAGAPDIQPGELKKGQDFEYIASVEVYPEIELKKLDGEKIEQITSKVADSDVSEMLKTIQHQFAEWTDVERASKDGDRLVIDFEGLLNDTPFEGGTSKDFELELGSNTMVPGFESGLVGVKPGDQKDLDITFPDDYPSKELAGQATVFKITVHKVKEAKLPEVDDKLADKMGIQGGIDGLKKDVRREMELELKRVLDTRNKSEVLDRLVDLNPVVIPDGLLDAEIRHLQEMSLQQMAAQQGMKEIPKVDLPRDPYVSQAERRVTLGLLLAEVIKAFELKVNEELVRERVTELAASYQKPDDVIQWYYNNKEMLAEIEALVLEDAAVDKLRETANIATTELEYKEALKPPSQEKTEE